MEKENPRDASHVAAKQTTSSLILNRTPIEVTPVKRIPLGNLENTPVSGSSRVLVSGGTEKEVPHGRASIFSGAVRVPKREKSSATRVTTPSNNVGYLSTTPRSSPHAVTPGGGNGGKKTASGSKGKVGYMQTTEAYRYSVATPALYRSPAAASASASATDTPPPPRTMTPTRTPTRVMSTAPTSGGNGVAMNTLNHPNHTPGRVSESPARNTKSPMRVSSATRSVSTPPSAKRIIRNPSATTTDPTTTSTTTTPVRSKTPLRNITPGAGSAGAGSGAATSTSGPEYAPTSVYSRITSTPTRSPARVGASQRTPKTTTPSSAAGSGHTPSAAATPQQGGSHSDVFSRLTANLPTRHTAPPPSAKAKKTLTPTPTKTLPDSTTTGSGKKVSSLQKKSAATKSTPTKAVKNVTKGSGSSTKKRSKKLQTRDELAVAVEDDRDFNNAMTGNNGYDSPPSNHSPSHNHSKSLIRDSSASSVMSMLSALPPHELSYRHHYNPSNTHTTADADDVDAEDKKERNGTAAVRLSLSASPNIGMFQMSPATLKLFSEQGLSQRNTDRKAPQEVITELPDVTIARSISTTPVGMSDGLDFDDNDTSDLTMTTIGSLASVMPLLVTDSCVSLTQITKHDVKQRANLPVKDAPRQSKATEVSVRNKPTMKVEENVSLIPSDADDVSGIYAHESQSRRGSQDNEDLWSRSSSPRSLALSTCWTQTTFNTFDMMRSNLASPLPFYDPQFDDDVVTSSMNSKVQMNNALGNVSLPRKKVFMNAALRAELSPESVPVSENNSVVSATLSALTTKTFDSASPLPPPVGDLSSKSDLLNEAMIRGDSFTGVSLSSCPSVNSRQSSHSEIPLATASAFSRSANQAKKKKKNVPRTCHKPSDQELEPQQSSSLSPIPRTALENDTSNCSYITMNTSMSTIHTINTVTSFNTAHTLNLGITTDTTDSSTFKALKASVHAGIHVHIDGQELGNGHKVASRVDDCSDVITPLSTCTSTMTDNKGLNRGFFADEDNENSLKLDPDTTYPVDNGGQYGGFAQSAGGGDVSAIINCGTDNHLLDVTGGSSGMSDISAPLSCLTLTSDMPMNKALVVEQKEQECLSSYSSPHIDQDQSTSIIMKEMSSDDLEDSNFSDTLLSTDTKSELLRGGSWDNDSSRDLMSVQNDDSIQEAFLRAGHPLPTPIMSSHTRDHFTFARAPPPPPPPSADQSFDSSSGDDHGIFAESSVSVLDISNEGMFFHEQGVVHGRGIPSGRRPPNSVLSSSNSYHDRDIEPLSKTLRNADTSPLVSLVNSPSSGAYATYFSREHKKGDSFDGSVSLLPPSATWEM